MAFMTLGTGEVVLFDDEDEERILAAGPWKRVKPRRVSTVYVRVSDSRRHQSLHRFILGLPQDDRRVVDHINHNGLDNRKRNLRIVSRSVNGGNRRGATVASKSGVRGVHWCPKVKKWRAQIQVLKAGYHVGYYSSLEEAAEAIKCVRFEWWGLAG